MSEEQPILRSRRPKRRVKPYPCVTKDGQVLVFELADTEFAQALKESEDEVIIAMGKLIRAKPKGKPVNETAQLTAAIKVLDLLADKDTPGGLLEKLEGLRHPALDALRDIVNFGAVAAARAGAGAYLLKAIKTAAPASWPPDISKEDWTKRMKNAEQLCSPLPKA